MSECKYLQKGTNVKCEIFHIKDPDALTEDYKKNYCFGDGLCPVIGLNSFIEGIRKLYRDNENKD